MRKELCGELPHDLVIVMSRQEGGAGALYRDGWKHNSFCPEEVPSWAQPGNGDGIMQVRETSGWYGVSGPYEHSEADYGNATSDGCRYLNELYRVYDSEILAVMQYNSGPNMLSHMYLNGVGDSRCPSKLVDRLVQFVPELYGLENDTMAEQLYEAQEILDSYLNSLPGGNAKELLCRVSGGS